jgi:VanZ family protein
MAAIFRLSSIPGDSLPLPDFRFSDKLAHFLAYALLGILIAARASIRDRIGGKGGGEGSAKQARDWTGIGVGILYGISDEIHQLFVPMRLFSLSDIVADALGVAAGVALCGWMAKRAAVGGSSQV